MGRSDDAKRRKKRGWPYPAVVTHFPQHRVKGEGNRAKLQGLTSDLGNLGKRFIGEKNKTQLKST